MQNQLTINYHIDISGVNVNNLQPLLPWQALPRTSELTTDKKKDDLCPKTKANTLVSSQMVSETANKELEHIFTIFAPTNARNCLVKVKIFSFCNIAPHVQQFSKWQAIMIKQYFKNTIHKFCDGRKNH